MDNLRYVDVMFHHLTCALRWEYWRRFAEAAQTFVPEPRIEASPGTRDAGAYGVTWPR